MNETIEQVSILADHKPSIAIVEKGYQGVTVDGAQILRSGQQRGVTQTMKKMIKRRSAIEPAIGHMKMDGWLARNPLKGALRDALHAVMCGAGHSCSRSCGFFLLCSASILRRCLARCAQDPYRIGSLLYEK